MAIGGFRLNSVAFCSGAYVTTLRPWDVSRLMCIGLSLAFQWIQNDCIGEDERLFLTQVSRSCPYLDELQDADENWTAFKLSVEKGN